MFVMDASRAVRASAIWRRVSGLCGRVEGEVDVYGPGWEEAGEGALWVVAMEGWGVG